MPRETTALRIGQRIRTIRLARKLTLQNVADATGMVKGQIGKIETGAPRTSPEQYERIARALGVSLSTLFRVSTKRAA